MFKFFKSWFYNEDGVAATEAALVFPLLLMMLLGTFDLGNGILTDQKTIRASQVTADLITRDQSVSDDDIDQAIEGGELALSPYSTDTYGVDIVSVGFDNNARASILWRETRNMTADADVLQRVAPLAEANSGVVVVIVKYLFKPAFAGFVVNNIPMEEIAFARGRRTARVTKE